MRLTRLPAALTAALALLWIPLSATAAPVQPPLRPAHHTPPPRQDLPGGWIRLAVQRGDSLSTLFQRAGLPASEWVPLVQLGEDTDPLRTLVPGETLDVLPTADGHLAELRKPLNPLATLVIRQRVDGPVANIERKQAQIREERLQGRINHSLARAVRRAGGTPAMAVQLARIFGHKISLSHDIRQGDRFSVVFEEYYLYGRPVQTGNILAASLEVNGREHNAFRYTDPDGRTAYYNDRGIPYEPSILRAPVHYTRISSTFSLHRMNPVLHIVRPHYGVDYAAPTGTPIEAAADGVVAYVGPAHGYGRLIKLRHFDGFTTRYGHMSAFAKGLHRGERVVQGQIIGYVGAAGEATGPHLHFEIRRYQHPYNPLKVKLPEGHVIPKRQMLAFHHELQPLVAALDNDSKQVQRWVAHAGNGYCQQPPESDPVLAALQPPKNSSQARCRNHWLALQLLHRKPALDSYVIADASSNTDNLLAAQIP